MQLLERFYDPTSGSVLVDEVDLKDYHLQDYRAQLAIVSQETTLYTGTIRENVLADKDDVSEEAIVQACKDGKTNPHTNILISSQTNISQQTSTTS
jgi:ATP-binding cassette subfamily B (MDR/TAP) protein 1